LDKAVTALILGDVVGQSGVRAIFTHIKTLIKNYKPDVVIVNGENAAGGFGITPEIAQSFFDQGVHCITSGNHVWQKKEIFDMLSGSAAIIRPANYPPSAPGKGVVEVEVRGEKFVIINLQGRERLANIDCPFRAANVILKKIQGTPRGIFVDFHAESTAEKEAMGMHLDGRVSAVFGTHTHIPTADFRVLPKGTAYVTDLGMTGPRDSVIGGDPAEAIERALTQLPIKMNVSENPARIHGIFVTLEKESILASSIERVRFDSLV
jgi:metallophosphoesterase (TIGR00282 family)